MNTAEPDQTDRHRHESLNIINALRRGTVPAEGLERIVVGLDMEEGVIARQTGVCCGRRRRPQVHPGGLWKREDIFCRPRP